MGARLGGALRRGGAEGKLVAAQGEGLFGGLGEAGEGGGRGVDRRNGGALGGGAGGGVGGDRRHLGFGDGGSEGFGGGNELMAGGGVNGRGVILGGEGAVSAGVDGLVGLLGEAADVRMGDGAKVVAAAFGGEEGVVVGLEGLGVDAQLAAVVADVAAAVGGGDDALKVLGLEHLDEAGAHIHPFGDVFARPAVFQTLLLEDFTKCHSCSPWGA